MMTHPPRQPLRVLLVSTTLGTGGAQRFTSTLLTHLDRKVVFPSLCLLRDEVGYPLPDDVAVEQLGYRGPLTFPLAVARLRKRIEQFEPDVALSTVTANNLLTGAALRRSTPRPAWIARIGTNPRLHDGWLRRFLARKLYPDAQRLVANAQGLIPDVAACFPQAGGRLEVIPNPTDFAAIDRMSAAAAPVQRGEGSLLVAVGRLFPEKRYDVILDALHRVQQRRKVCLWVCGDGPEAHRLARQARRLGLESVVRWLGFCENPFSLMKQADLFVMTSDHEGLPNALIEAQGLGLPAVCTRSPGGSREVVEDGSTGRLVPPGDAEAASRAIEELLDDPDRRRRMSAAARAKTRREFDCKGLVSRWQALLVRVAAESRVGKTR